MEFLLHGAVKKNARGGLKDSDKETDSLEEIPCRCQVQLLRRCNVTCLTIIHLLYGMCIADTDFLLQKAYF